MVFNAFSPNNDGVNEVLTIEDLEKIRAAVISVFDVKGREVDQAKIIKMIGMIQKMGVICPRIPICTLDNNTGQNYTGYIQLSH